MDKIIFVIAFTALSAFALGFLIIPAYSKVEAVSSSATSINVTIHNTSRFHAETEVKCDWNDDLKHYDYYKKIELPGKKKKVVKIPVDVRNCEVWPRVNIWR